MESYDAIVVGAGPAGNQTALALAEGGHRVAVLDWRRDVGDKLCTGIIGIDCVRRFPPDDSVVHHRANSATVVSPAGNRYRIARGEPQATVIDRAAYVAGIARRAMGAGAEYRLGERVNGLEVLPRGVEVSTGGEAGRPGPVPRPDAGDRERLPVAAARHGRPSQGAAPRPDDRLAGGG